MMIKENKVPTQPAEESQQISRRGFLLGAGMGAIATGAATAGTIALRSPGTMAAAQADEVTVTLEVNQKTHTVTVEPDTPLLWVLRDTLGLTGTKYGCGIGLCGACAVHVDGKVARSCTIGVGSVDGASIITIEGLGQAEELHPVQAAWIAENVPQCGYCQSGQIMAAAALLAENPKPTNADIDEAMTNICRCGTYNRIRRAIHRAAV